MVIMKIILYRDKLDFLSKYGIEKIRMKMVFMTILINVRLKRRILTVFKTRMDVRIMIMMATVYWI